MCPYPPPLLEMKCTKRKNENEVKKILIKLNDFMRWDEIIKQSWIVKSLYKYSNTIIVSEVM